MQDAIVVLHYQVLDMCGGLAIPPSCVFRGRPISVSFSQSNECLHVGHQEEERSFQDKRDHFVYSHA